MEKFLTVEETAQMLKVKTPTVRHWLREGHLPAFKMEWVWRIREADILAHVKRHGDSIGLPESMVA